MIQLVVIEESDMEYYEELVNSTIKEFQSLDYEILNIENNAIAGVKGVTYVCFITYKTTQNP